MTLAVPPSPVPVFAPHAAPGEPDRLLDISGDGRPRLLALGLILIAGLGLRLVFMDRIINGDEALNFLRNAVGVLDGGVFAYDAPNNHVFYALLMKLSVMIFGESLWAMRLPSLCAGLDVILLTYLLFRKLYHPDAGLMAAALAAASSPLIEYDTSARGYSLLTLIFLLMFLVMVRLREADWPRGWWLLAGLGGLGLFTVPTMAFALSTLCFWWLFSPRLGASGPLAAWQVKRFVPAMAGAVGLAVVLYLPVVYLNGLDKLAGNQYVTPAPWSWDLINIWGRFWPWLSRDALWCVSSWATVEATAGFFWFWVVLALASPWWQKRLSSHGAWPVAAVMLGCAVIMLIQGRRPYERIFLFAVPLFLGAFATGLATLAHGLLKGQARQWACIGLALGLLVVNGALVLRGGGEHMYRDDKEPVAFHLSQIIRPQLREKDTVGVTFFEVNAAFYLGIRPYGRGYVQGAGPRITRLLPPIPANPDLLAAPGRRLWLVCRWDHEWEDVLTENRLPQRGWGKPKLMGRYFGSSLYLVEPEAGCDCN